MQKKKKINSGTVINIIAIIVTIISIILTISYANKYYDLKKEYTLINSTYEDNSITAIGSPNSDMNTGTKIEGDFSQTNSVTNFGEGVTTIGNVNIGTDDDGNSFIALGGGTMDYVASQNTGKTWAKVLFATPDCNIGIIDELHSGENLTVAKCSSKNSCEILSEFQLLRNSMWLSNYLNQTIFVGTYFENVIPSENIENCFDKN